jgi:hypothetical protein
MNFSLITQEDMSKIVEGFQNELEISNDLHSFQKQNKDGIRINVIDKIYIIIRKFVPPFLSKY